MADYRPVAAFPAGMRWSELIAVSNMEPVRRKDARERDAFKLRLGYALKEARKQAGLIQEDVAEFMGIDNDTVSRWETAGREIRVYDLARLVDRYQVMGDLFLHPPERITDVEGAVRRSRALRVAWDALQASLEAEQDQEDDDGASGPPTGRPS